MSKATERHWSQVTPQTTTPRRTLFVQVSYPAFGKAVVICECGERKELTAEGTTNPRGRPRKPVTALQLAEEWTVAHIAQRHQSIHAWEFRQLYELRPAPPTDTP